ncbi:hypothetical protein E4U09_005882, partial [Claviceps aff. purpurea]
LRRIYEVLTVDEPMHVEVRGLEHVAGLQDAQVARQPSRVVVVTVAIVTCAVPVSASGGPCARW